MCVADMFRTHRSLRAVIDSAVEGELGEIVVDDDASPSAARLELGCYTVFGGQAASAEHLVMEVQRPAELIVPEDQRWRDLLLDVWGERLEDRPMRTYSSHFLVRSSLETLASRVPKGYGVEPFDVALAQQLDDGLVPHALQVFRDVEHFIERGAGFAAVHEGQVVAASTSYTISSKRVEVSVSTRDDHRGCGLATSIAAHMLMWCLSEGKNPDWSASNPISKHIAMKLGYRPAGLCDVFYLGPSRSGIES